MGILEWMKERRAARSGGDASVDTFVASLSARDAATGRHVDRVACIATEIGHLDGVSDEALLSVEVGARLHDLRKLAIPDSVLKKAGRLTHAEWNVMRHHPQIGAALVRSVPTLSHLAEAIEAHHERWDGEGYPHGLKGETIPLAARIFALANSIDAMTSDRPYQEGKDWGHVADELRRHGGSQWDPRLAELTLASLASIQALELGCPHGFVQSSANE